MNIFFYSLNPLKVRGSPETWVIDFVILCDHTKSFFSEIMISVTLGYWLSNQPVSAKLRSPKIQKNLCMLLFKGFTLSLYPLGSESELLCKQLPRTIHTTWSEINFLVQGQLKNTHRVLVLFHCLTANLTFYRLLKPFWKFISLIFLWSLRAHFCTQALFLSILLTRRIFTYNMMKRF